MRNLTEIKKRFDTLTPKQREVCLQMADGWVSKRIANETGISVNTVKTHRMEIFRKMEAQSLLDLSRMVDLLRRGGQLTSPEPLAVPEADTPLPAAAAALRVVVVEDNPALLDGMVEDLLYMGHDAIGAANGQGLEQLVAAHRSDIVLLDVGLGEGEPDGFEVAERLRRVYQGGIVMVTARGETAARVQGLEGGADAYMVKPVDFTELNAVMGSVMRRLRRSPAAG